MPNTRVIGGPGIAVPGIGSVTNPYVVTFVGGHPDACRAVADCMGNHLDQGLLYNTDTHLMSARLSGDDGNTLRFGTDGGIYTNNAQPSPNDCSVTVDGLPAAGVLGGYGGAGRLIRPAGLTDSFLTAARQRLHMTWMDCYALVDDTVVTAPFPGSLDTWTDQPPGAPWNDNYSQLNTPTWANMIVRPSSATYNPYVADGIDPRVGWYGFREPSQTGGTFADDVFRLIGGKVVIAANVAAGAALAVRDEIQRHCLQKSVVAVVNAPSDAAIFTNSQIQAGLRIATADEATANPPASLVQAGITWVFLQYQLPNATITPYKDAGLQVMLYPVSRHVHAARVTSLGLRGFLSDDPMYASAIPARYRSTREAWAYKAMGHGYLTPLTDNGQVQGARGFMIKDDIGWFTDGTTGAGWFSLLLGQLCPIPWAAPDMYRLTASVQFRTAPSDGNSLLGLVVCAADDRVVTGGNAASGQFYLCGLRQNGHLVIHKYDNGTLTILRDVETPAVTADPATWTTLQVRVEPNRILLTRVNPGGTDYNTATADTDFRGPYASALKWTVGNGFVSGFQSVGVAQVTAADTTDPVDVGPLLGPEDPAVVARG